MKKVISVILSVIACFIMVACEDSEPIVPNSPPSGGTEQSGGNGDSEVEEPETPNGGGGGNVVTPISPGGDYNGGGY